jgi:hypothetical protein
MMPRLYNIEVYAVSVMMYIVLVGSKVRKCVTQENDQHVIPNVCQICNKYL